ncbi:hypothetical protein [Nocardia brasiliensis]|uniref:hypothetical protein n=1 Tax=Nocardia brasiliensis TaxID=37326 RepID=UPI00366DC4CE
MTYEPALWAAAATGAVMAYRMRWWKDFPESRLFTMAFGALCAGYVLAIQPVAEGLNQISIDVTGSAIALLASVLLGSIAFCAFAAVPLEILTGSRYLGRYVGAAWAAASAIFVGCWIAGEARHSKTLNSFAALDVPAEIFAITYAGLGIVTALTTVVATWRVLQRKDLRPKLRRAIRALFVSAVCLAGLAVTLLLNAFVLDLSSGSTQVIEQMWWLPMIAALAVAGL